MMQILPLARLLRIPNVFTAFADIALGICVTIGTSTQPVDTFFVFRCLLLLVASGCLYCGGMVWNDYFDREEDRQFRPFRPIPSGKISTRTAILLGMALLLIGWIAAAASGWDGQTWHPNAAILGGFLVAAILLYDGYFKSTSFAPIIMASCRFLNVLLGLSLCLDLSNTVRFHLAITVGVYIVAVTWFAKTEEQRSETGQLRWAAMLFVLAGLIALALPTRVAVGSSFSLFPYLLFVFAMALAFPIYRAIREPVPATVQRAVKRSILGLILLDAILATVFVGMSGLLIVFLLPPALVLGKWVYST